MFKGRSTEEIIDDKDSGYNIEGVDVSIIDMLVKLQDRVNIHTDVVNLILDHLGVTAEMSEAVESELTLYEKGEEDE